MAARALGPLPPLGSMWGPPRAAGGSLATEASAAAALAARRGGAAVSSALFGLRGRHSCSVQFMDGLRSNIQAEVNLALSPKASMSNGSDKSTITTCKGFCTIAWYLKADVQDGYLIFITGDPVTLGCWESNMAVQLAPVEKDNIWTAEIKLFPFISARCWYQDSNP